jgi:transposase-like protein
LQCPHCHRTGFVRHENIVRGSMAERHFFCGMCGRHWKVKDRRSQRSARPSRDRSNDHSRMWA